MSAVDRVGASRVAWQGADDPTPSASAAQGSHDLERRPGAASLDAVGKMMQGASGLTMLFALQVSARESNRAVSESAILGKKEQLAIARQEIAEAMKKAQEEANKSGLWGKWTGAFATVAKVATLAAAAASVVATGGLSAPLALALGGMLLSVMSKPLAQATGLGDKGAMVLNYAGMATSLAGGGVSAFSSAAAGTTATAAQGIAKTAGQLGQIIAGSATAASGGTSIVQGYHQAQSQDAQADETGLRAQQKAMMRQMEALIEILKEADKSIGKAKETLTKAIDAQASGTLALASMGVRA